MPADMNRRLASVGVIQVGTPPVKMVHHAADCALVSRNMSSGEHNGIAFFDGEIFVIVQRKPRQSGHRLALASTRHNANLFSRVIPDFLGADDEARWNLQKAQLLGSLGVLVHPPSEKTDDASVLLRLIDDQLQARNR